MHLYRAVVQQQQHNQSQSHWHQRSLSPVMAVGNGPMHGGGESLMGLRRSSELSCDIDESMSLKAASSLSSR
ncbi:hypothetical protein niasHT_037547 [Heterodera trifolii]|uniref:Uncharacterized protein n=1 Tax=Heterodera trifolii TaxID=157864 RepID=A0ABD2ILX6_9BILA